MKTLLILRHAKSSWASASMADHDRPLNQRGKADAPVMGRWLRKHDLTPDLIVSSTAKRAKTTAELVADGSDYSGEIVFTRDFYHAGPDAYEAYLRTVSDDVQTVMVVGHNPGMEILVEQLSGAGEVMSTCNVAWFELAQDSWADFDADESAELKAVWRPKEIG